MCAPPKVAGALANAHVITHVQFGNNKIGTDGALALASSFAGKKSLQVICLSCWDVGDMVMLLFTIGVRGGGITC